ncbi:MAG: ribonuclease HI family protein [Actinobacteria bacterium]|nr:ribonuclease HI family protein [Actinomycetota bacterium]
MISVYTDGGARGNPGPASIGVYIENDKNSKIFEFGRTIGVSTNNVAEYQAVIEALNWLVKNETLVSRNRDINFYMDSNLVCSQITGIFKVKNANLKDMLFKIREKEAQIKANIRYFHIPREKNKKADRLVNMALDNELNLH